MCRYIIAGVLALYYLGQFVKANPVFRPVRMPTICAEQNKTYCAQKDADYPENRINSLLEDLSNIFQEVRNDTSPGYRVGSPENLCHHTSLFEAIYVIVDENDRLRYVAQSEEWFNQIFYIEECINPGPVTKMPNAFSDVQLKGEELECQQKYMHLRLLVLSLDGTKLEAVNMKNGIPVCCSCIWKKHKRK